MKTKQGRIYKHKPIVETGFVQGTDGRSTMGPTVPSPADEICDAEAEAEDGEARAAGRSGMAYEQAMEQARQWLSGKGLRKPQQELVLGMACEGTILKLTTATGRSRAWVYAELKKPTIKQAIVDLKSGKVGHDMRVQRQPPTDQSGQAATATKIIEVPVLTTGMKMLRKVVNQFLAFDVSGIDGKHFAYAYDNVKCPDSMPQHEKSLVQTFHYFPKALSNPNVKDGLIDMLEKLLIAARFGGKAEAAKARKTVKLLTRFGRGNPRSFPPDLLTDDLFNICECLTALRKVWQVNLILGRPLHERLETIRQGIGTEEKRFSDTTLQSLMGGDLLKAACRVAEVATGIGTDVFERASRESQSFREQLKAL